MEKDDKGKVKDAMQLHRERIAREKIEKKDRKNKNRREEEKTKDLKQLTSLKDLRKNLNPTKFIPYRSILADDGYLGHRMAENIKQRKAEIMEEMSNIMKVEERFPEKFKEEENGKV